MKNLFLGSLLALLFAFPAFAENSATTSFEAVISTVQPSETAVNSEKGATKASFKEKILEKSGEMAQKRYERKLEKYRMGKEPKKPQGPGLGIFFLGFLLVLVALYSKELIAGTAGLGWIPPAFLVLGIICFVLAIVMAFGTGKQGGKSGQKSSRDN